MHDVELLVRVERRDEGRGQRDEHQEREDPESPRRRAVAKEAAPALVPHRAVAERPDQLGRHDQRDTQREPRAQRHAVRASASASARTRSRGSAMPTRMSASRLPATTTVLATNALAVTTG